MSSDLKQRSEFAAALRELVVWGSNVDDVPPAAQRRAATILMDDIGAIIAGAADATVTRATHEFAETYPGDESTIFTKGAPKLSRRGAAAANGLAIAWCELDEGYRLAPCHAGAYILPALLAQAEHAGSTVAEVLRALAVSYEILTRLARAVPFPPGKVHPHAAFAMTGAALGPAVLGGGTPDVIMGALTSAASMTFAGPFNIASEGALARNAWTGIAAVAGLDIALLARLGVYGSDETAYDAFVRILGTGVRTDDLLRGLGERWAVEDGYHKIYACCQYTHATVEASLNLYGQKLAANDIKEILVETHPYAMLLTTVEPATVLGARFSIPHAAAAVAVMGTGGEAAFTEAAMKDEAIAGLRHRVVMKPFEGIGKPPHDRPARVTWTLTDGHTLSAQCESAVGGPDRPISPEDLRAKFAGLVAGVFPNMPVQFARIIELDVDLLNAPWRDVLKSMT